MEKDMEELQSLYRARYGTPAAEVIRLAGAGGDRQYYRMRSDSGCCIGTVGDSERDCRAFVGLDRVFYMHGVPVPEIYGVSDDMRCYIQQDLGDRSLFSCLGSDEWRGLAEDSLKALVRLQTVPESEWGPYAGYKPYSRRQVMWDLNYFKYEYLKPARIDFDEERLEDDMERLAEYLSVAAAGPQGFMMRDFQSRNVMIHDDKPLLIDFQGGRRGPVTYDAISFLWQAKAGLKPATREGLMELYAFEYEHATGTPARQILDAVRPLAFFRTLQVLGAYGFRGLVQKRAHFIESIPAALDNLSDLMNLPILDSCPELARVCREVMANSPVPARHDGLLIKVYSFSYKRGYPEDYTGNGGGFMFDCRGMHNPGRYAEYKSLTGRDKPVIDFLESRGEVQKFVADAEAIVSPSVECYLRRGFSNLQIGFGCTGGQHRSVYCAEAVAHAIKRKYPKAQVMLIHRERGIEETL